MSTKSPEDEAALIADLNATFPDARATSLRTWAGNPKQTGAVVCGEALMPDGSCVGLYAHNSEDEAYDGLTHKGFEAWCKERGWYVELYDAGVLWVVPLPSRQELDECNAAQAAIVRQRIGQPGGGVPF